MRKIPATKAEIKRLKSTLKRNKQSKVIKTTLMMIGFVSRVKIFPCEFIKA